jgi:hypothetical protein
MALGLDYSSRVHRDGSTEGHRCSPASVGQGFVPLPEFLKPFG